MAFPGVSVNVQSNNLLSAINVSDAVPALFAPDEDAEESGNITLVYSASDAKDKGVGGTLYEVIEEFYDEVGGSTALYVVDTSEKKMSDILGTEGDLVKLVDKYPDINLAAVYAGKPTGTTTKTGGMMDDDVVDAVTVSKSVLEALQSKNTPVRVFIDGYIVNAAAENTYEPNTASNGFVAVVAGGAGDDGHAAVGTALGRATKISAHVKLGDGSLGALSLTDIYFGTESYRDFGASAAEALHDAGYLTFMQRQGLSGYYFGVDNMATNDDFRILVHGRVIDKAVRIAVQAYMPYIETSAEIADDGSIDAADAEYISSILDSQLRANMEGQFSNCKVVVDAKQDIINTSRLKVGLSILPLGYLSWITVDIGLATSIN